MAWMVRRYARNYLNGTTQAQEMPILSEDRNSGSTCAYDTPLPAAKVLSSISRVVYLLVKNHCRMYTEYRVLMEGDSNGRWI
jgi:hypothetical protein